jgi:uncharacterized membrane protein (DUF4010 family)
MTAEQQTFYYLSVALAIGLLIGAERGWEERNAEEGARVAGLRTHGLIGLLGGAAALLTKHLGTLVLGLTFTGLAALVTTTYVINLRREHDIGVTSFVAMLLTFMYGALAVMGEVSVAAAAAVVTTLLLSAKPVLHRWLSGLNGAEVRAGIQLLLISVVVLPILPNQGYGPWQAINPYAIWWMVVLIAAISFAGYVAVKVAGTKRGIIVTGLLGGLASSTALTLHFSRMARDGEASTALLSMGILLACGTMLPRMLLVASVISPDLTKLMLMPAGVMALFVVLPAVFYWRSAVAHETSLVSPLKNPLELNTAFAFGFMLALIMLFGKGLNAWFGTAGLLALAAVSGITDVDAITLSLARMSGNDVALSVASVGLVIAAVSNSLTKGIIATAIGGPTIALRVGLPLLVSGAVGLLTVWWQTSVV